jgi:ABC-2 type transport system ATP-binding protein
MDEAERCDRIAIIDEGLIVAIDTPAQLKASVGADAVTVTTGDDARARQEVLQRLGIEGELRPEGLRLMVNNGEAFVPRLFDVITVGVSNVNVRRPTLDDVFIKYTGRAIRDVEAGTGERMRMSPMVRSFRGRR